MRSNVIRRNWSHGYSASRFKMRIYHDPQIYHRNVEAIPVAVCMGSKVTLCSGIIDNDMLL